MTKETYAIRNVDSRAKTLIIEYPVTAGHTLIDTAKPVETAADVYRFEVKVPASGDMTFPVSEENVYDQTTQVSSLNPAGLVVYIQNKNVSDAARRQLQQIADLKTQIAAGDTERRQVDTDIQSVTNDEQRNRQNIASLSQIQRPAASWCRGLRLGSWPIRKVSIAKSRDGAEGTPTSRKTQLQTQLNGLIDKLEF